LKSLLVATTNTGKFQEFSDLLKSVFRCSTLPKETPLVVEDGTTYKENALKKAKEYFERFKVPVLSDDSGLEIDVLGGAPGVFSANFGGESLSWPDRWNFLYNQLGNKRLSNPSARFRCVLCYYDGVNAPQFFEATTEGSISPTPQGSGGFGYDPIFFSSDLRKSLGEATLPEKSSVSHRARATKKFLEFIQNQPQ